MTMTWLEPQRNGRMAPVLKGVILVVVNATGVAAAACLAVGFGKLVGLIVK